MIVTVLACLAVYGAASLAAPAAGWEGIRLAYSVPAPPVARTLLIAAVEIVVGFGTAALAVGLSLWTPPNDLNTLLAAAAVGIGFGIARSLRSARNAAVMEAAARQSGAEDAEALKDRLGGIVRFAVIVRSLAAMLVPIVTALLSR
ncbi:MAG: hypothetical protein AAGI52_14400 [Bacteroidota bacterium]